jgi:hypothetical protein
VLDRAGRTVAGWLTCELTQLFILPISGDHHWIWVVPAIALFADTALRARGAARWRWWALAAVTAALFGAWGRIPLGEVTPCPGASGRSPRTCSCWPASRCSLSRSVRPGDSA